MEVVAQLFLVFFVGDLGDDRTECLQEQDEECFISEQVIRMHIISCIFNEGPGLIFFEIAEFDCERYPFLLVK